MTDYSDYYLCFALMPVLTTFQKHALISFSGGLNEAWELAGGSLKRLVRVGQNDLNLIERFRKSFNPSHFEEQLFQMGFNLLTLDDNAYPERLKSIFDPPFAIFLRGKGIPEARNYIAIVGARKATKYGLEVAEEIAQDLSDAGVCVVSGGALGIDAAAHRGALKGQTPTVAVMGCGIDISYPRSNADLLENIAENGAVISEYPPGIKPFKSQFPERNRIVSGLSDGVVVVEATKKSGALITAHLALNEGRTVFCVPGSIKSPYSKGTHSLLRDGAVLTESADDVILELNTGIRSTEKEERRFDINENEKEILSLVEWEPKSIDEIALSSKADISIVTSLLAQLEVKGAVKQVEGERYIRS